MTNKNIDSRIRIEGAVQTSRDTCVKYAKVYRRASRIYYVTTMIVMDRIPNRIMTVHITTDHEVSEKNIKYFFDKTLWRIGRRKVVYWPNLKRMRSVYESIDNYDVNWMFGKWMIKGWVNLDWVDLDGIVGRYGRFAIAIEAIKTDKMVISYLCIPEWRQPNFRKKGEGAIIIMGNWQILSF